MKKVEAQSCIGFCSVFDSKPLCGSSRCRCNKPLNNPFVGICERRPSTDAIEMEEEHQKFCQSHTDCTERGIGTFCARYPNSDNEYGWCFASSSEAEEYFKIASKYKFTKEFLKMPITA